MPSDVEPKQIIEIEKEKQQQQKQFANKFSLETKVEPEQSSPGREGRKSPRHPECGKEMTCNPEFYHQQTYLPKQVWRKFPHRQKAKQTQEGFQCTDSHQGTSKECTSERRKTNSEGKHNKLVKEWWAKKMVLVIKKHKWTLKHWQRMAYGIRKKG